MSFRYLLEDVSVRAMSYIKNVAYLLLFLSFIVMALAPIYYYRDKVSVYTYGPAVMAVYFVATGFIVADYVLIFTFRNRLNPTRWKAVFLWLLIWIFGTAIQFFNNKILLVSFCGSIGMMIVFTKLENPDLFVDSKTGMLNELALRSAIDIRYAEKRPFSLLVVKVSVADNRKFINEGKYYDYYINSILRAIDEIGNAVDVYAVTGREFYLLYNDEKNMQEASLRLGIEFSAICGQNSEAEPPRITRYEIPITLQKLNYDVASEQIRYFIANQPIGDATRFVMDQPWIDAHLKKFRTIQMIDKAIAEDRIVPFFQPIFSIRKNSFVSAEALVRILSENGEVIQPGAFIPVAEETGQIEKIGEIVFEKTCKFIKENDLKRLGIEYIEINLSAIQCLRETFADKYIETIDRIGTDPSMINFEITETSAVKAKDRLLANMDKLIKKGCSFSLDDFGTGYSNLEYVQELPVKILKFDRKMVLSYFESRKGRTIMEAVIFMCKRLGLEIVAEGIEESTQFEDMVDAGVDFIQGYYFSAPIPAKDFLKLVE